MPWPVLSQAERRVLGVLVEKAKTTPDIYPLSLNALTTGCNQKSNRDPVLNLSEDEVLDTLTALLPRGLVTRIQGGRVERWKHNLYEHWTSHKVEIAILAELLLRGPQTEGDLRGHAGRMEPIEDLPALRSYLQPLLDKGLAVRLGPEGRRGTLYTHGFHAPKELEIIQARGPSPVESTEEVRPGTPSGLGELREIVQRHEIELQQLRDELLKLKQALGG